MANQPNNGNGFRVANPNPLPPFPWSAGPPPAIHTVDYILNTLRIATVEGVVVCRRCGRRDRVAFDLRSKFHKTYASLILGSVPLLNDLPYPNCAACGGPKCVKPVVADRAEDINWLFLFLGQTLGACRLDELRWYCKKTNSFCTGSKKHLLYLTYVAICRQLRPDAWLEDLLDQFADLHI